MNHEPKTLNQKGPACRQAGFAPILIVIPLAVIIVIGVIIYGYFIARKNSTPEKIPVSVSETVSLPPKLGSPGCEDVDYTGCDTSSNFMTWTDDGERNP